MGAVLHNAQGWLGALGQYVRISNCYRWGIYFCAFSADVSSGSNKAFFCFLDGWITISDHCAMDTAQDVSLQD